MKALNQFTLVLVLVFGGLFTSLTAQTFGVKPATLEYPLEPGQTAFRTITVTNLTDVPKTFNITTGDFMEDELGNIQRFGAGATARSCALWVQIEPATFELAPNESKRIRVTLSIPDGQFSTKWAELLIQSEQELTDLPSQADRSMRSQLNAQGRIAVPILQSPASNTNFDATVANLRETEPFEGRRIFQADLQNTGDKLVTGQVVRTITHLETGEKIQLPPVKVALLPQLSRRVEFELPTDLAKGSYNLTAIWQVEYQKQPKGTRLQVEVN